MSVFFYFRSLCFTSYSAFAQKWVGTWTTAQQLVEPHNLAPEPGLSGNSIREIVQVSVGGEKIRVKFSNEHGKSPLNIKAVEIAIAQSSGSSADVKAGTSKSLKFKGKAGVTIEPGKMVASDAIDYKLGLLGEGRDAFFLFFFIFLRDLYVNYEKKLIFVLTNQLLARKHSVIKQSNKKNIMLNEIYTQICASEVNAIGAIYKLFISLLLGGIIGVERRQKGQVAGMRTFALISMHHSPLSF